jgi:GMP synthase (glutamine-hydrolysing)
MKSAVVIRHVHFEDLGAFAPVLERRGYRITYLEAGVDPVSAATDEADLLVVLGGPIGAYEDDLYPFLGQELEIIGRRLARAQPLLGICLGAQLIARTLGARVYPGPAKEIGWGKLDLTEAGRCGPLRHLDGVPVLHWHGDTFDLPAGALRLASTAAFPNQAFSVNDHVLALQFHPEAAAAGFERWLIGHACEIAATAGVSAPDLRSQAGVWAARAAAQGQLCLDAWLDVIEQPQGPATSVPSAAGARAEA